MKFRELRAIDGCPPLPFDADDVDVEQWLIAAFIHGSRLEARLLGADNPNRKWRFYIDQTGTIRGEVRLPVRVDITVRNF